MVPGTATNVVVRDDLPSNTRFLFADAGSECTDTGNNVVTCDLGELVPGDEKSVGFFVCPTGSGTATNIATVSSDAVVDPRPDNNRAEETTEVTEPAVAGGGAIHRSRNLRLPRSRNLRLLPTARRTTGPRTTGPRTTGPQKSPRRPSRKPRAGTSSSPSRLVDTSSCQCSASPRGVASGDVEVGESSLS